MAEHPVLAGAVEGQERSPVRGVRPCRISRPCLVLADHRGLAGRAWEVDLDACRRKLPPMAPRDAMVAHWIIEAPWTSEVIHSYSWVVVHLRPGHGTMPVTRYLPGATHELALWAINPETDRCYMLNHIVNLQRDWLMPTVFQAQIAVSSDELAARQAFRAVELMLDGRLSPHASWAPVWGTIFGDNMLRVAVAPKT